MAVAIEFKGVNKWFGQFHVLSDINLDVIILAQQVDRGALRFGRHQRRRGLSPAGVGVRVVAVGTLGNFTFVPRGRALRDLRWLGLDWNEPVLVQSKRTKDYAAALDALKARGLVYACFCTRADIAASLTAPHGDAATSSPGTCRGLPDDPIAARTAFVLLSTTRSAA